MNNEEEKQVPTIPLVAEEPKVVPVSSHIQKLRKNYVKARMKKARRWISDEEYMQLVQEAERVVTEHKLK